MTTSGKWVAYYRVSTERQGRSGLGLEAQREAVRAFLAGKGWPPLAEVVEVESGKRRDRPRLAEALALCRVHGATLVIGKLDRLARNAAFPAQPAGRGCTLRGRGHARRQRDDHRHHGSGGGAGGSDD